MLSRYAKKYTLIAKVACQKGLFLSKLISTNLQTSEDISGDISAALLPVRRDLTVRLINISICTGPAHLSIKEFTILKKNLTETSF